MMESPIIGWGPIARAVSAALGRSCDERTARRWAEQDPGRRPKSCRMRLPVLTYPDRRVYLLPEDLRAWAQAWLAPLPSGARATGRRAA